MQKTLAKPIHFSGLGLHTGRQTKMCVRPAKPNTGIRFIRTDAGNAQVIAQWFNVKKAPLRTVLENDNGVRINTVEHIIAALAGCGINNAYIDLDTPEVPICDGSAHHFVSQIINAGFCTYPEPTKVLKIAKPVSVECENSSVYLEPCDSFQIECSIEFLDTAIGVQNKKLDMSNGTFVQELSASRTFCCAQDIQDMVDNGLIQGGSYENAVVFEKDQVLNPEGLRYPDEPVRHKMLDVFGDLALAGMPIIGYYRGYRPGHALNNQLLHQLFSDVGNYDIMECYDITELHLPGAELNDKHIPVL